MPANDNAHALRLCASLAAHATPDAAEAFAQAHPLSKSADIHKKFDWARVACNYLTDNFDEDAIRIIRRDCRCNDGKAIADKLSKYLKQADSIRAFTEAFNRCETFASLEYINERELLLCYPQCYCACVKRVPETLSAAWCLCTLGNAQGIFTRVFGEGVRVSLTESIKTGAKRCAIHVSW